MVSFCGKFPAPTMSSIHMAKVSCLRYSRLSGTRSERIRMADLTMVSLFSSYSRLRFAVATRVYSRRVYCDYVACRSTNSQKSTLAADKKTDPDCILESFIADVFFAQSARVVQALRRENL